MPQEPDEAGDTPAPTASERHDDGVPLPEDTRVVIKADLRPAGLALVLVALTGVLVGAVWALVAPSQLSRTVRGGPPQPVSNEYYHVFDDLAIFFLLCAATGVLVGAVLWMLRGRRGPVLLLAGVLGGLAAAWLALAAGTWFAALMHQIPATPGALVAVAPTVSTPWVVFGLPLGVAISYGIAASWNSLDGLGR